MKYVSTRGRAPTLEFADVLLTGLATDGGLYVPETWPALPAWARGATTGPATHARSGADAIEAEGAGPSTGPGGASPAESAARPDPAGPSSETTGGVVAAYVDAAAEVIWPYVEGSLPRAALDNLVTDAYADFDHPDVCPLVEVEPGVFVMELFHGPTLAFKDVALQLVGRLFDRELARRGRRATIVVATSGDTGAAAIEACVGRETLDVVVLHPAGRVSDVQRRMMTTVAAPNVHNVAVEGTFDDCQALVKALFADAALRERLGLSAMNSINWARVVAQIVYYVVAAARLGRCEVAVPTGNFGNVLAGWIARRSGAPIDGLVIGSNRNDILTRWVRTGELRRETVAPTLSPAMDIQVSSNHERLLFELLGRDGAATAELMARFAVQGAVEAPRDPVFVAASLDDEATVATIGDLCRRTGYVADPHTAVGVGAGRAARRHPELPLVCLATAHPAKFPDAVERATGRRPALPEHLADLPGRPERYDVLPADLAAVRGYVESRARPS